MMQYGPWGSCTGKITSHAWECKDDDAHGSRDLMISMAPCAGKDDDALVMLALIATAVFTATAVFSLRGAAVDSGPLANHY